MGRFGDRPTTPCSVMSHSARRNKVPRRVSLYCVENHGIPSEVGPVRSPGHDLPPGQPPADPSGLPYVGQMS